MENKVELKKFIIKIMVFSLTLLLLFFLINILEYKTYTRNFNNKINAIVSVLQEKYPNLEEEKISLRIWIDESVSYDSYYYGKFLLEELEEE